MPILSRYFRVAGLVQGVGFRPCVYRIAIALNLKGEVFNDAEGVGILLEGEKTSLDSFEEQLRNNAPPLSRIDSVSFTDVPPTGYTSFVITKSRGGNVKTTVTPDAAVCRACLADIFDPENRRYRYAFTNCTHCGPRYTITRALPYDRRQTSMAVFPMCEACSAEYADPVDRRFHAQPNACPTCGPHLTLVDRTGTVIPGDPIQETVRAIRAGKIAAIKGLGGFHLACDARNSSVVNILRHRKRRDEKPFAVMFANAKSAEPFVEISAAEKRLLEGTEHPIVLLKKRGETNLAGVADNLSEIGVLLPYTPVHWLIFHEFAERPNGVQWTDDRVIPDVLVMTSANPSDEPLVTGNDEALRRLCDIADVFLMHNRDIVVGCDDSVIRPMGESFVFIRRARGYTPRCVKLSQAMTTTLATGPYLKNTMAVNRSNEAFLSQHIGKLSNTASEKTLEAAIDHLCSVLEVKPEIIACDAHPDFFSSRLAKQIAEEKNLPLFPIYHHAAHIGVAMAEAGRGQATLGFALDGTGLGPENGIWGGELLLVDAAGFSRENHLSELALVGGDKAATEPWRMGAALLCALERSDEIVKRYGNHPYVQLFAETAGNKRLTRRTSALGRYFDGLASLLGLCDVQHDEATAAMRLEALAEARQGRIIDGWSVENGEINLFGALKTILDEKDRAQAAADFHRTLARALAEAAVLSIRNTGCEAAVAITGGCAANRLLVRALCDDLKSFGICSLIPEQVPPGDGGLSLGELWLAALCFEHGYKEHSFRKK